MGKVIITVVVVSLIFVLAWANKDDQVFQLDLHFEKYHPEINYSIAEKNGLIYIHLENKVYCELFPGGLGLPGIEILK